MLQQLRLFLTSIQFFTRIPVPEWVGHSTAQLDQASRYFPATGFVVGGLAAAVWWFAAQILPSNIALILSMTAGILVTGAFHEDGLSDFVDGFGGGYTPEKILTIMKDSHVGAYGVIAIVLALLLKFTVLHQLSTYSFTLTLNILVAAHVISRLLAASLIYTQRYVRLEENARAKPVAQSMSDTSFVIALIFGASAVGMLICTGMNLQALAGALAAAISMRVYLAALLQKNLGGYTGDCLGAVQQLTEIAFYLGLLAALPK
jgi:adenosylcobinamide-GDP ribazoletransferase